MQGAERCRTVAALALSDLLKSDIVLALGALVLSIIKTLLGWLALLALEAAGAVGACDTGQALKNGVSFTFRLKTASLENHAHCQAENENQKNAE